MFLIVEIYQMWMWWDINVICISINPPAHTLKHSEYKLEILKFESCSIKGITTFVEYFDNKVWSFSRFSHTTFSKGMAICTRQDNWVESVQDANDAHGSFRTYYFEDFDSNLYYSFVHINVFYCFFHIVKCSTRKYDRKESVHSDLRRLTGEISNVTSMSLQSDYHSAWFIHINISSVSSGVYEPVRI